MQSVSGAVLAYWYPAQERVEALTAELKALEAFAFRPALDAATKVSAVSAALSWAARADGFPDRQLREWIWIGSQYRLEAARGGPVAGAAGAALAFLCKRVERPVTEQDIQDLNWVLETTIRTICDLLGKVDLLSYLNSEELSEIEKRLAAYADATFDAAAVRRGVEAQLTELAAFSNSPHLRNLTEKVEALFLAAHRDGSPGRTARAALLYLAEVNDVVRDSDGFLGLMDDVYVIDLAYATVERQTRCLPLLQGLLENYPFVADLALVGTPARPLDLYGQYIACAALDALFEADRPVLLVVRESGPFAILSALFAAVEAARRQANLERERLGIWSIGQHVVVSDGAATFKVIFQGEETVGVRRRFRLGVDKQGSLTAPVDIAPYMATAAAPHKRLSNGKNFGEWLKARHADPVINLTGAARTRATEQECILLLGPRSKLDVFAAWVKPLGTDIGAAIGLRYVTGDGRHENIGATATDTPFIYACSDVDTAHDLIRNPPVHVRGWRVVVDGARQMRALHASLTTDGQDKLPPMCVVAELFDRETSADLLRLGLDVWYLEDQDVQPPPAVAAATVHRSDPLDRMLARQGGHWNTVRKVHSLRHDFLEALDAWMVQADQTSGDEGIDNLELRVSNFMRASLTRPVATPLADRGLRDLGRGIAMQAASLKSYSALAADLHRIFSPILDGLLPDFERRAALAELSASAADAGLTAVVCRSSRIAAACAETTRGDAGLEKVVWTNLEGARARAPFERVIVPGWLDRLSMRELADNGYGARLDLMFYPFERRWFDRTMAAGAKWERRIERGTIRALSGVSSRLDAAGRDAHLWRDQTSERLAVSTAVDPVEDTEEDHDAPEFEKLEARNIDAVRRAVFVGREHQTTAKAQLVIFEEPGTHAFLPPGGKVIVLSGPDGPFSSTAQTGSAEKLLFRSVASLEAGCLLALPMGGDRDLIDIRADQFLTNAHEVRETSAKWKAAIRNYIDRTGVEPMTIARCMAKAGVKRDVMTIRSWAANTATIAPRGYKDVIPVIAQITSDVDLLSSLPMVLQAIDLIYRARAKAADAIVGEIFSGGIDLDAQELTFDLYGSVVRYALHRVQSLQGLYDVPIDIIGRVRKLVAESLEISDDAATAREDA